LKSPFIGLILIRELITYLSESPALKEAVTFGHLAESISLLSRERRCQKTWGPHRAQCKNFISTHLNMALNFDSILVLGSGPLHEIPIEILTKKFKRVVLVDIVHLKSTRKALAHLTNIEFIEHDLTEIEAIIGQQKKLKNCVPQKFLDMNWGLILSVNVMSQLPLHLGSYIKKRLKNKFPSAEIESFLQNITRDHLQYLQSFSAPVVLITDVETDYYDKSEKIIQKDLNYSHLHLPEPKEQWMWNVAPIPEFRKDIGMKMLVRGFVLKNLNSH
jgi:hypothetical protein